MNTKRNKLKQGGMAMITAVIVMAVMLILLISLGNRVSTHHNHVEIFGDFKDAYNGLETAMSMSIVELENDDDGWVGVTSWSDPTTIPTFDDNEVVPEFVPETAIEYFAYVRDWSNDGEDNVGNGQIDDADEENLVSIHVSARKDGVVRNGYGVFSLDGGGTLWDQVISARSNFEVDNNSSNLWVHGPVHILGEGILEGEASLNMTPGSYIHDSYDSLFPHILDNIPPLPLDSDGDESINTTVRVKQGSIHIQSNGAELGQSSNNIDGFYSDDGITGQGKVYSDNGEDGEPYDINSTFVFPDFTSSCDEVYLQAFLEGFDLADEPGTDYVVYQGDMDLPSNSSYYWNVNLGLEVAGSNAGSGDMPNYSDVQTLLASNDFFIWWDHTNDQLIINGRIAVFGDFSIGTGAVFYHGKGSVLTWEATDTIGDPSVIIASSLSPRSVNTFDDDAPVFEPQFGKFPTQNLLAIMANQTITFDIPSNQLNGSEADVYGAFYAQDFVEVTGAGNPTSFVGGVAGSRFESNGSSTFVFVPEMKRNFDPQQKVIDDCGGDGVVELAWVEIGVE